MRIILCGKNDAAVACLEFLVEHDEQVWVLGTKGDDGEDGWQRSLKKAALKLGVSFDQPADVNDADFIKRAADFESSVLVSIQYDQILREPLLRMIGCPCANLHFSLLPRNRGVAPIAWAILNGDPQTGATLHHMTPRIDAGDVIAQRAVPISSNDTARDVYDKVSVAAVDVFKECYPFSCSQLAVRAPQDPCVASYHRQGEFDFSRTRIDWRRPAARLHRWIRAMIFPPFQYPEFACNGRTCSVARIGPAILDASSLDPGHVVAMSAEGLDVAAAGGVIRITDMIDRTMPTDTFRDLVQAVSVGDELA